jgi:hypothetical protein
MGSADTCCAEAKLELIYTSIDLAVAYVPNYTYKLFR